MDETNCTWCVPGKYQTGSGLVDETNCTWCVPGKYQTGSGLIAESNCSLCVVGKYSTLVGAAFPLNCTMCSPGKYQSFSGANGESNCTLCQAGFFTSNSGSSVCLACLQSCPLGWVLSRCSSTFEGHCYPMSCPSGYHLRETQCVACNSSRCGVGYYRGACGPSADAECRRCSNKPVGNQTMYISAGLGENDCRWACRPMSRACEKVIPTSQPILLCNFQGDVAGIVSAELTSTSMQVECVDEPRGRRCSCKDKNRCSILVHA